MAELQLGGIRTSEMWHWVSSRRLGGGIFLRNVGGFDSAVTRLYILEDPNSLKIFMRIWFKDYSDWNMILCIR